MDHLLKRQEGDSKVSEKQGLQREQAHLFRDGAWGRVIRTEKPGEPGGAPAEGVISRAVSEAGSGSGGQKKKKKIPVNWKQLLVLGLSAAARGSVATMKIKNKQK